MSIWFFSDPHLGLNRLSHTTTASRRALGNALVQACQKAVFLAGKEPVFCLGDVFDVESNDESVIAQAAHLLVSCQWVLGGNHDLPNRSSKLSSLQLLEQVSRVQVVAPAQGEEGIAQPALGYALTAEAAVYGVPHCATQALFEEALARVVNLAQRYQAGTTVPRILCLHCNYASSFADQETSLNLTREWATQLLETFDYILLGHEHIPRTDLNGRLRILGNTHPTSFSDLSDKFAWEFDGERFIPHLLWSEAEGYRECAWPNLEPAQFVRVTGQVPTEQAGEVAQAVAELLRQPEVYMVRNDVTVDTVTAAERTFDRALDVPARITQALENSELAPIWAEYLTRLT
jgi:DNA repair exonuclease SbcCD nuclease subunit